MSDNPYDRTTEYKQGINRDLSRQKRTKLTLNNRNDRKTLKLKKKRKVFDQSGVTTSSKRKEHINWAGDTLMSLNEIEFDDGIDRGIDQIWPFLESQIVDDRCKGTYYLRKLLNEADESIVESVCEMSLVQKLMEGLGSNIEKLIFESCWCLTCILLNAPDLILPTVNAGIIFHYAKLLVHESEDVREQSVWGIGNIASDSIEIRNQILAHENLFVSLLKNLRTPKLSMLRNGSWTITNLTRGKPLPEWSLLRLSLSYLIHLLHAGDEDILKCTCWTLSYMTNGPVEQREEVVKSGVIRKLVQMLGHTAIEVQTPALRVVGNLTNSNGPIDALIKVGVLEFLKEMIKSTNQQIKKESIWVLSNITAGTEEHVESVVISDIMPTLFQVQRTADFNVKKEIGWVIYNFLFTGNQNHMLYLIDKGCIPNLIDLLELGDPTIVLVVLQSLEKLLVEANINFYINEQIEMAEGTHLIEYLQEHNNEQVYRVASRIIEHHFGGKENTPTFDLDPNQLQLNFGSNASFDQYKF